MEMEPRHLGRYGLVPRQVPTSARLLFSATNANCSPRYGAFALKRGVLIFLNGQFVPEEQAVVSVFDRGFL
jgi:hypothetical protein